MKGYVRPNEAKEIARRLVSSCGSHREAMNTLVEGSKTLPAGFGNLLFNVSLEIASVKSASRDAFKCLHSGRTRKGGTPSVRRYL